MYRLLFVVAAAIAGAAIWRRKELRNDADRASKAVAGAASSARARVGRAADDVSDAGTDDAAAESSDDAVEQPDAETAAPTN